MPCYATDTSKIHELQKQTNITVGANNSLAAQSLYKARKKSDYCQLTGTREAMNKSQMQTLLYNNILHAASARANHRVTAKPLVPSGPCGCRTTLSLDDEHSLVLLTS